MARISVLARRVHDAVVAELYPAEVQVPEPLRSYHRKGPHNNHQCYPKTWEYAVEHRDVKGIRIAHGTYQGGFNIDHAWVELPDGVLFDGTLQCVYGRERYCSITHAIKEVEYSVDALCKLLRYEGHFGPYHETYWQRIARRIEPNVPEC